MTPQQKTQYHQLCSRAYELRLELAGMAEVMCQIINDLEPQAEDRREVTKLARATRGLLRADTNLSRLRVI